MSRTRTGSPRKRADRRWAGWREGPLEGRQLLSAVVSSPGPIRLPFQHRTLPPLQPFDSQLSAPVIRLPIHHSTPPTFKPFA
jgi:hypothetical protein